MGFDIGTLGMQAASGVIGAGMGIALGNYNDKRQVKQQQRLQDIQIQGQRQMMDYSMQKQLQMWKATSYPAQLEMMKQAGINPALMYGMSGGGGTTTGSPSGNVSGGTANQNPGEIQQSLGMAMQLQLLKAQKDNIEADTKLKETDATLKGGPQTENIKADTANKIADQIIKDYTGRETKDQYEQIKAPNREAEGRTYENELAAREGVAQTLRELWDNGKLYGKSLAEIETITLQNAKTRAETKNIQKTFDILEQNLKGASLDNVIKELETKLQTQTGIDSKSPTWLKILGRLFVELTK